jgi:hypothetical protein
VYGEIPLIEQSDLIKYFLPNHEGIRKLLRLQWLLEVALNLVPGNESSLARKVISLDDRTPNALISSSVVGQWSRDSYGRIRDHAFCQLAYCLRMDEVVIIYKEDETTTCLEQT